MTTTLTISLCLLAISGLFFYLHVRRATREISQYSRLLAQNQRPERQGLDFAGILSDLRETDQRLKNLDSRADAKNFSLQTILASMAEGVVIVDANGEVHENNQAFLNMFSLRENPTGRRVWEVLRQPEIKSLIEDSLREHKQSIGELIYEDLLDTGNRRKFFKVSVSTLDSGTLHGAVAVFHDISRIVQLEELRKEFIANVSHELRTPLSIFHGYLETLLSQPDISGDEEKRIFQVMKRHSDRLNSLVEDLLMLSRLESGNIQLNRGTLPLDLMFEQLREDWSPKFLAKNCSLKFDLPDATLTVNADKFRMEQVFYNLLENALKYSDANGEVRIGATVNAQQDTIEFYVRDNGIGIPSDKVDQIFQRFFRVDKARSRDQGGTGLGLAIVKHIVQIHGGRVWAESDLGKGTTVWFNLPR